MFERAWLWFPHISWGNGINYDVLPIVDVCVGPNISVPSILKGTSTGIGST